jgi:hypothetical protein
MAMRSTGINMRIIVAEDEYLIAFDLAQTLRMAGHRIIGAARTTSQVSELLRTDPPDLALVDVGLSGGSQASLSCGTCGSNSSRGTSEHCTSQPNGLGSPAGASLGARTRRCAPGKSRGSAGGS